MENSIIYRLVSQDNDADIRRYIRNGFNPYTSLKYRNTGDTIMHIAARHNSLKTIKLLKMEFGISPTIKNDKSETPLFISASLGKLNIFKYLLSCTFFTNLDIPDINGYTPLLIAYKNGYYDIARMLIRKGCVYSCRSYDNYYIPLYFIYNTFNEIEKERITIQNHKKIAPHIKNQLIELLIEAKKECSICYYPYEKNKTNVTDCGHHACTDCLSKLKKCHICRKNLV